MIEIIEIGLLESSVTYIKREGHDTAIAHCPSVKCVSPITALDAEPANVRRCAGGNLPWQDIH